MSTKLSTTISTAPGQLASTGFWRWKGRSRHPSAAKRIVDDAALRARRGQEPEPLLQGRYVGQPGLVAVDDGVHLPVAVRDDDAVGVGLVRGQRNDAPVPRGEVRRRVF